MKADWRISVKDYYRNKTPKPKQPRSGWLPYFFKCAKLFDAPGLTLYFSVMNVLLTSHQEKFVGRKMRGGGYLSPDEVIREALRVYELVEQEDKDQQLAAALRHSLRSPVKRYQPGHFAALAA